MILLRLPLAGTCKCELGLSGPASTGYKGSMISTIVIVGAGQAGAQAVDTLRREGFSGRLVLIGDEPHLPYQRPPLSKKYLAGELAADRLPFRHRSFYDEHRVELKLGVRAVGLDPQQHQVALENGETVAYDRLLLCLGAESRQLTCPGVELSGVHYLRGIADVEGIRAGIKPGARVVIIGGGYIGLETAATCRKLGCEVTVLEMADRVMNRVAAESVSEFFCAQHRAHGVNVVCSTQVVALQGNGKVERVLCADGTTHEADLLVVGVGCIAATRLAREAGLACDNGILVDEFCRTSDASIYAAGDCTNHLSRHFGRRIRLESVDNAFEQAKTAALNLLDRNVAHDRVPWFWSDQFEHKLLIIGLSQGHDQEILRGDPATRSFSVCYLKNHELLALEAVNHSKDYMAARKVIAERLRLNPEKVADPSIALKDAV
jgi:3-phenylpropionate/trans-cinnamate dioxygenase ferredoxin reductase subunit